jgi:hypothetical protein
MPVLVVIGQDAPGILELLGRLYGVGIVIPKDSFTLGFVQRQRVTNPVGNLIGHIHLPRLQPPS